MTIHARYTTLHSFKTRQSIPGTAASDDTFIDALIDEASDWITRHARGRVFVPYYDTREIRDTALDERYQRRGNRTIAMSQLLPDEDLLAVTALVNGDADATAMDTADIRLLPLNDSPKSAIELASDSGESWQFSSYDSAVSVTGWWGYHSDYAHAWASASTLAATLTASDTGAAIPGTANYVDGDYVLIGGSEVARVTGVAAGTLTLLRGQNGSTGTAVGIGTAVQVFQPMHDIQNACDNLVKYYYIHRKSDSVAQIVDVGVRLESKVPTDVWDVVTRYQREGWEPVE